MSPAAASLIRRRRGGLLDPLMRCALSTQTLNQLDIKQTQSQSQIQTSMGILILDLDLRYFLANPSSSEEEKEPSVSHSGNPQLHYEEGRFYISCLVESPNGNDLFLVYRDDCSYFKVFKLNPEGKWTKVSTVGDMAIFVGINQSVSVSATDFPNSLKANSIYFTALSDYLDFPERAGVLSLEDETLQFFKLTTNCQDVLEWPRWEQPAWFIPATTS